jgi:hypothetical protein
LITLSAETNISPFEVWSIYTSMCLHFKKESSYDAFKFNFKGPRLKKETFLGHRNRYEFEKLARAFPKKNDLILYFLSNILRDKTWISNMSKSCYDEYLCSIQALSYRFKSDMAVLRDNVVHFDESFTSSKTGQIPVIYKLYQANAICLESLVVLDTLVQYTNNAKTFSDPLGIYCDINHKIIKYKPFLRSEVNFEKYKNIILNMFTNVST